MVIEKEEQLFTPSDAEIKEIANEVGKIMINEFNKTTNVTWESLINSAKFFIQRCDELANFSISLKQFDILKDAMGLVKKSNQQLVLLQATYAYAFWFDEQLKQFRGQVPSSALFVLESKKYGLSTYELPLTSLIKYVNAADKNRLNASNALLKKEFEGEKKESIFNEEHVLQAQAAYAGVSNRLERYWERTKTQRQDGLLLWKENKEWVVARVLNKGDLKEAYAAALMSKHNTKLDKLCGIPRGVPDYYSHDLVRVFFNEHISKVSNAAAIREEDIVMEDKQYGVKSFRAELPSLAQYYDTAQWILNHQSATKEDLENEIMKGKEAFRNEILGRFNLEGNENLNDLLEQALPFAKKK